MTDGCALLFEMSSLEFCGMPESQDKMTRALRCSRARRCTPQPLFHRRLHVAFADVQAFPRARCSTARTDSRCRVPALARTTHSASRTTTSSRTNSSSRRTTSSPSSRSKRMCASEASAFPQLFRERSTDVCCRIMILDPGAGRCRRPAGKRGRARSRAHREIGIWIGSGGEWRASWI